MIREGLIMLIRRVSIFAESLFKLSHGHLIQLLFVIAMISYDIFKTVLFLACFLLMLFAFCVALMPVPPIAYQLSNHIGVGILAMCSATIWM